MQTIRAHPMSRLTGWLDGAAARIRHRTAGSAARADDWALWRMACAGHAQSAQQLVRALTPPAYGLALQLLRRSEDAEDAVQDAFLRLWRSHPSDTRGATLSTYFNTIVINRCRSRWTSQREDATDPETLAELHDAQQAIGLAEHPADHMADVGSSNRGSALERGLARLPVRQRMAVVMWAYADAGVPDIARALDIDPNAAHQLLHRAKQALRLHLEGASP
ncbi:MAG: RNA polymerase sigma factor [Burkholderiaceae bacterium]|nr:RNA polymerase sigma factor [Burkholderiaceae bacterium]